MIVLHDEALARRLKRLRHQGMSLSDFDRHGASPTTFETYPEIGYNFRITDIQAAVGTAQLDRLDGMLERRRRVADLYNEALADDPLVEPPFVPSHLQPNWQSYQVRMRPDAPISRNGLMEALHEAGIATRRGVMASHLEAPYAGEGVSLPVTEAVAASTLQLPMHSGLTEEDAARVVDALSTIAGRSA